VVFRALVASALESALSVGWAEIHLFLCISSESADSLQYHFAIERHPAGWFLRDIAGYLCMVAFIILCPGHSTPCFFTSRIPAQCCSVRYCVSFNAACENTLLAFLAIFKAREMLDSSRGTRPPRITIVADLLNTYKQLVAASINKIWLLYQPYMLPSPPLKWLKAVLSHHQDAYQDISRWKSQCWQHHNVLLHGVSAPMPWSTIEVFCYSRQSIECVPYYTQPLYVARSIYGCLQLYGYTHIQLHAAPDSCCSQCYGRILNVHHRS